MARLKFGISCVAALLLGLAGAHAEGTVKIGIILPYSGQFADAGNQLDNGIKLYVAKHGDTVAGKKLEFVRKDVGGIAPDVLRQAGWRWDKTYVDSVTAPAEAGTAEH